MQAGGQWDPSKSISVMHTTWDSASQSVSQQGEESEGEMGDLLIYRLIIIAYGLHCPAQIVEDRVASRCRRLRIKLKLNKLFVALGWNPVWWVAG